jgi:hypothetical protein
MAAGGHNPALKALLEPAALWGAVPMLSRVDRFIIAVLILIVAVAVALPVAIEGPMFARCTQSAMDILARADPLDRRPPVWLVHAVEYEVTELDLPLAAARMSMHNSHCNGRPARRTVERMFETLGLSVWWRVRLSHEDIVGLYVSQAWLGVRPMGFSAASHAYFGRSLTELTPAQQRCIIQKLRSPNPRAPQC